MYDESRYARLLEAIRQAQSKFILESSTRAAFLVLLDELISLTESEYGFIGEVEEEGDQPRLRVWAYTDISWNEETRRLLRDNADTGLVFDNMNTLFGHVITQDQVVISNGPDADSRAGGIPDGHPPLNAFLGVPFRFGKELIGVIGLANRPQGYSQEDVEFLAPLITTCGILAHSRKMAEEKDRNQHLHERAERTRCLVEFSQKLAHDLNNLLTIIRTVVDLHQIAGNDVMQSDDVDRIRLAADRATGLTKKILKFAGSTAVNRIPVSVPIVIKEALTICQAVVPPNIRLSVDVQEDMPKAFADAAEFQQALVNVIFNSIEAIGAEQGSVQIHAHASNAGTINIELTDDGPGMDEATRRRAFDPYFSTKSGNRGFGLGSVLGFVNSHRAALDVRSEVGCGTSIKICLPSTNSIQDDESAESAFRFEGLRILAVDDQAIVLDSVTRLLHSLQADVVTAHSGEEALEVVTNPSAQRQIELILLDVSMPNLDGLETSRRIRRNPQYANVPIVFMSGYTNQSVPDDLIADAKTAFLAKPFSVDELKQACERVVVAR